MDLSGKHLLLGVSGGIAAYKSVQLLREFQKAGADVRVVMTPAATRFVGPETFATLSRHSVAVDVFNNTDPGESWTRHIHWAEWADLFVITPCTANTLSKLVHGLADNMLVSVALATRSPMLLCPTMDGEMMRHPAVKENLDRARRQGCHILEPEHGYLASGLEDKGRMPEPATILDRVGQILTEHTHDPGRIPTDAPRQTGRGSAAETDAAEPMKGKKILVTAGPTREPIDAVRYISNPSSGKMGFAMAAAARELGGNVTLLHGPVHLTPPAGVKTTGFLTTEELLEQVRKHADADVVIMAAAVADFRPGKSRREKLKKGDGPPDLALVPTPDILEWLGEVNRSGQIRIGFAMETEGLLENARRKRMEKNMHWICANNLSEPEAGFESDRNRITLLGEEGEPELFEGPKEEIARRILARIFAD